MKKLILFALLCLPLSAQINRYASTTGDVSLSGAGTVFTIQQQTSGTKTVTLESAVVYCSVACNITQAQNGAAATTTAGTVISLNPGGPGAQALTFTASNVGAGTNAAGILHLTAGNTAVLDLSKITLPRGSSAVNYSITISSITGTANITFYWSEPQ